jgi:uncharacterized membrane protein YukC
MNIQKTISIALAVLLIAAIGYIAFDKWQNARQKEIVSTYQQGYGQGLTDAVTALFQQTENCKATTLTLGNLTRQIFDVACLQQAQK